jgi:hypothetical protein
MAGRNDGRRYRTPAQLLRPPTHRRGRPLRLPRLLLPRPAAARPQIPLQAPDPCLGRARLSWYVDESRQLIVPECSDGNVRLACTCGAVAIWSTDAAPPAHCAFCHAGLSANDVSTPASATTDDQAAAEATRPNPVVRRRVFVAEITCLLCGREAGTAMADRWPPTGPILFQPPDAQTPTVVRAWWRLRCAACGGNTAADELTTRSVRLEPVIDWREVRPRRGRPPKWLVEQRRADAVRD